MAEIGTAEAALTRVHEYGDEASRLARSAAPVLLAAAEALYAGYRAALACPEAFSRGGAGGGGAGAARSEAADLVERSIRAEFAVALGVSERVASRELEQAQLLTEDLPRTRAALAAARIRWEAGQVICSAAATLPVASLAAFDERAAEVAVSMTPTQLRRAVARLREELHEQPLADRHARARDDRSVRITPELDRMATLSAHLPAAAAVGAFHRLDRIARSLRDGDGSVSGDGRTLAQLRADALTDLLCDGDVSGTTPVDGDSAADPTFVPGIRAEVRLTLSASTAAGLDDHPADLDGYGPVPAAVAQRLAGPGPTFTCVTAAPGTGTVLDVGRTLRVPPPRMRLLLQLRDRTCRFPGCTRPASTAEADHTLEWRHGGTTAVHNLASLCVAHHHVRHGDRWTYALHPDAVADWTTPTGRRVTTRPAPLPGGPPEPTPRPRFVDPPAPF
ncbi:HNH endonuclease signature motif containing protein [Rathayibacter sp. SD072]|uniref:HNH endonuclease signature motif containing protein n=1 Tax=Rathayibacter sp. SD072 TaxID=2781731 RepID=UPI001A95CF73|nr:HNH endonuclease signature motif containing protein [Rathayibacter sp. SD072]MBO0985431.1 DUF222 domain-containing protein [Rathayibacter sp. SD072]